MNKVILQKDIDCINKTNPETVSWKHIEYLVYEVLATHLPGWLPTSLEPHLPKSHFPSFLHNPGSRSQALSATWSLVTQEFPQHFIAACFQTFLPRNAGFK